MQILIFRCSYFRLNLLNNRKPAKAEAIPTVERERTCYIYIGVGIAHPKRKLCFLGKA